MSKLMFDISTTQTLVRLEQLVSSWQAYRAMTNLITLTKTLNLTEDQKTQRTMLLTLTQQLLEAQITKDLNDIRKSS